MSMNTATFTRASSATLPDGTSVASGVPRFVTGRKATGDATDNLFDYPLMNVTGAGNTDWGASGVTTVTVINSSPTEQDAPDSRVYLHGIVGAGANNGYTFQKRTLVLGGTYTVSFWFYVPPTSTGYAQICTWESTANGWVGLASKSFPTEKGKWVRKSLTFTVGSSISLIVIGVGLYAAVPDDNFSACLAQVEAGSTMRDFTIDIGAAANQDKALFLEQATTNYIENPNATTNLSSWGQTSGNGTLARRTDDGIYGNTSFELTHTITGEWTAYASTAYGGTPLVYDTSAKYTLSFWVKSMDDNTLSGWTVGINGGSAVLNPVAITSTSEATWQRFSVTFTPLVSNPTYSNVEFTCSLLKKIRICGIQLEKKTHTTSFIAGVRADEILSIPSAYFDFQKPGSLEMWVYKTGNFGSDNAHPFALLFHRSTVYKNYFILQHNINSWRILCTNDLKTDGVNDANRKEIYATDIAPNGWVHTVVTWTSAEFKLYINGKLTATILDPPLPQVMDSKFYIGSNGYDPVASPPWGDALGEVKVYDAALTAEQVKLRYLA